MDKETKQVLEEMSQEMDEYRRLAELELQRREKQEVEEAMNTLLVPKTDAPENAKVYSRYFKPVPKGVTHIDVYRVLAMFNVIGPGEQHAIKKLLCAGERGAKGYRQDLVEARDAINRQIELYDEDGE